MYPRRPRRVALKGAPLHDGRTDGVRTPRARGGPPRTSAPTTIRADMGGGRSDATRRGRRGYIARRADGRTGTSRAEGGTVVGADVLGGPPHARPPAGQHGAHGDTESGFEAGRARGTRAPTNIGADVGGGVRKPRAATCASGRTSVAPSSVSVSSAPASVSGRSVVVASPFRTLPVPSVSVPLAGLVVADVERRLRPRPARSPASP